MPRKFTPEELRKVMNHPDSIRNISIIAHVDHGKTTLTDSLVAPCGIIRMDQAGETCLTDTMELEKQKGITIKSTGISLYYDVSDNVVLANQGSSQFIINVVDSPGHVDFSSEVTAALRVTDGALVVVDCIEKVCVQTETVLRQALTERIRPVLCINKLDRAFLEVQLSPEEMYQSFCRIIEEINVSIATYGAEDMGDMMLSPVRGNVAFCAGKQAWAFTLSTFAKFYAAKMKISVQKCTERLWGDNFWDPDAKKWTTSHVSPTGRKLQRGFCMYILEPLKKIFSLCCTNLNDAPAKDPAANKEELFSLLSGVGVNLPKEDREKNDRVLLKAVLQTWLPAHEALLEMIVQHLPSPRIAQAYRVGQLYEGPQDDVVANAIRNCDASGPLMVFISKLVQDKTRFIAFGRVFSGTAKTGAKVRVLNSGYMHGSSETVPIKSIQRTLIMMGRFTDSVDDVPAGNTIGLVGVDDAILKTATLTDHPDAWPLVQMKYSVSPVVRCAVSPTNPADLLKLIEGIKKLAKLEPFVTCSHSETGEHVIAAAGELHLEICLHQLRDLCGVEITTSDPVVNFKETITKPSSQVCLAKSSNKHNRLYVVAEPLGDALTADIESGKFGIAMDPKSRAKLLTSEYGWNPDEGRKIWCFGPNRTGANVVVDVTKGQQLISEIADPVVSAFQWYSESGALCEEEVRGTRFNFVDAHLHADAIHRGAGQIIPTARRVFCAAQLTAEPRLQEPIFLAEIVCPVGSAVGATHRVLSKRRGFIIEEIPKIGTNICTLKAHLPVMESFGFTEELRAATSGQAFPSLIFDHWSTLEQSPFEEGKVKNMIIEIRKRKGLTPEIPPLERFLDRL